MITLPISPEWTLFLDRDGVINQRFMDHYVLKAEDFVFLPGVCESIAKLAEIFGTVLIVTNQQGIGKGLMTSDDLNDIHQMMLAQIKLSGGRIDKIYYCPGLKEHHPFCRKPSPGMALQARKDFPHIRFKKSVMVGDTLSDMQFGKNMGMKTVLIGSDRDLVKANDRLIDYFFLSLVDFANHLQKMQRNSSKIQ